MAEKYITRSEFHGGTAKKPIVVAPGTTCTAEELGLDDDDVARFLTAGLLDHAAEASEASEVPSE